MSYFYFIPLGVIISLLGTLIGALLALMVLSGVLMIGSLIL